MHAAEGSHGLVPPSTPSSLKPPSRGDSAAVPKATCGSSTIANFGKGDENQDTFVATCSETGTKCFVGVFDGHGEKGKVISHLARATMSKSFFNNGDIHIDPKAALEAAYRETHEKIEKDHRHQAELSGTTAVAAYQHRNRLVVANLGDSRAVLGRCDTARQSCSAVDLSSDQKPSRPDERQRVLAAGGKVDQMAIPIIQRGGVRWIRAGPERVMDKQGMGGLAMSRSLGDLRLHPAVSSVPEVIERRLDSRDKCLVLATDGVWDQLSSQEAVDIANKHEDPRAAAREITGVSRQRWQVATEGQMCDDITVVVVKLNSGDEKASSSSSIKSPGASPQGKNAASTLSSFFPGPQRRGQRQEGSNPREVRGGPERGGGQATSSLRLPEMGSHRPGSHLGRTRSQPGLVASRPVSTGRELLPAASQRISPLDALRPAGQRGKAR